MIQICYVKVSRQPHKWIFDSTPGLGRGGGDNMVQEGNRNSTVRSAMSSYLNLGTDLSAGAIITLKDGETVLDS